MRKDENGYIVVETLGTFIPFVLLVVSVLSLVNIVALQSRVHYAMTQTANTLSMYSYTLEVSGIAVGLTNLGKKAGEAGKTIDSIESDIYDVMNGIQTLKVNETASAAGRLYDQGERIVENPKETMQLLLNYGADEIRNAAIANYLIKPLVGRYLGNGNMTGDTYLRSVNVIDGLDGLNFYAFDLGASSNDSVMIDANGDVKIVVQYEIEYKFGNLPLPFEPKLKVVQTVKTKAWLGGSPDSGW